MPGCLIWETHHITIGVLQNLTVVFLIAEKFRLLFPDWIFYLGYYGANLTINTTRIP